MEGRVEGRVKRLKCCIVKGRVEQLKWWIRWRKDRRRGHRRDTEHDIEMEWRLTQLMCSDQTSFCQQ